MHKIANANKCKKNTKGKHREATETEQTTVEKRPLETAAGNVGLATVDDVTHWSMAHCQCVR